MRHIRQNWKHCIHDVRHVEELLSICVSIIVSHSHILLKTSFHITQMHSATCRLHYIPHMEASLQTDHGLGES